MRRKNSWLRILMAVLIITLLITAGYTKQAAAEKLPNIFAWSSLRAGSTGNSQAVGFGEAVSKKTGVQVRVVPVGREMAAFIPLRAGEFHATYRGTTSTYSLGSGVGKAFATEKWGPQPVRVLWAAPLLVGYATIPSTGIKTAADLKGKRVPDFKGWATGVQNLAALLAGAGLTKADTTLVPVAGFRGGLNALMDGKTDVTILATESAVSYELAAKKGGIVWIESPKDPAGIKRQLTISPWFTPGWMDRGAGLSPESPSWGTVQRYLLFSYDYLDPNLAYVTTKAIWEGYDIYKDLHPSLKYATHEVALDYKSLFDPYHKGSVKFFKEIGVWTTEMEAWQKEQIALQVKRKAVWEEATNAATRAKLTFTDPAWYNAVDGFWVEWLRERNLISMPQVEYHEYKK